MNKNSLLIDTESRIKLTSVLNKNFIVEAGAGSGKTTALVQRMVAMVESGIDVASISCITFTKAAANEFYERFQKLLSLRCFLSKKKESKNPGDLEDPTKDTIIRCQEALKNIDLCFMGTIDSFVQKLINEHPYEFNVPYGSKILDNNNLESFIKEEYINILNGLRNEEFPDISKLCQAASKYFFSDKDFVVGVKYFLDLSGNEILYSRPNTFNIDLDLIFKNEKKLIVNYVDYLVDFINKEQDLKLNEKIRNLIKEYKNLNLSWDRNCKKISKLLSLIAGIKLPKDIIERGLKVDQNLIIEPQNKKEYPSFNSEYFIMLNRKIMDTVSPIKLNLYEKVAEILSKELKKNGYLSYRDFIIQLRDCLKIDAKNGGKIIKYIQQKRKYYLLDEFQDTNPIQTEIFFYLTATNFDEDYRKSKPIPGSLFIVGDPKQSIYRFTGADVTAFTNTKELFNDENSEVLYLTKNFRSSKKLREWFNDTMGPVLDSQVDKANYVDIPIDPFNKIENNAKLNGVYYYSDKKINGSLNDSENLVYIIKNIVNNPKFGIVKKYNNEYKIIPILYKDIMVICYNKPYLSKIVKAFSENEIPFYTEGRTAFEESEALNEIKDLFNVLVLPNKVEYVYKALLTKYIDLSESDLVYLYNNDISFSLINEENIIGNLKNKRIKEAFEKLLNLYESTKYLSYSGKLLYLIENTNLYERHKCEFLEYVYYSYELVKKAEIDGEIITSLEAIEFVRNINSSNENYERCFSLATNSNDCGKVHIANLHKTKGLEAPIVILCNPLNQRPKTIHLRNEKAPSKTTTYIFNISENKNGISNTLCEVSTYGVNKDILTGEKTNKCLEEELSLCVEKGRLQYVAATRARNVLIISNIIDEKNKENCFGGYWKELFVNMKNSSGDILELIKNRNKDNLHKVNNAPNKKSVKAEDLYKNTDLCDSYAKEKSFNLIKPSSSKIKKIFDENDKEDNIQNVFEVVSITNKEKAENESVIKGTLVHRMMELIASSKNKYSKSLILNIIFKEFANSKQYSVILENVYDKIQNGGFDQQGNFSDDILNILLKAKTIFTEVPFSYMEEKNLYHGVMDLVFMDQENKWHIIDYKTNKESSVNELEKEYIKQLNEYVKAFKVINNLDADAHIYHIDIR